MNIDSITKMSETDLSNALKGSWHDQYRESAYIYVGGLNCMMNEGDISVVFSQFGEIVDLRLSRDTHTGKSKGFAFICYEDQRSTDLAVDNLNGVNLCGKKIKVDHCEHYKVPKEYLSKDSETYKPSGPDGLGWGKYRGLNKSDLKKLE